MARGVKRLDDTTEVMKLGKIVITRPDKYNWQVSGDDRTTFHVSLAMAIMAAVHRASEVKSRNAVEWLAEYRRLTDNLTKSTEYLSEIQQLRSDLTYLLANLRDQMGYISDPELLVRMKRLTGAK